MQFKVLFELFNYTSHYGTHHITTHIDGGFPPRPWFVPGWPASCGFGCPLPLVLWDSHPLAVSTPSGPSLLLLLGWMCGCHWDVWPRVFGTLGGLVLLDLSLSTHIQVLYVCFSYRSCWWYAVHFYVYSILLLYFPLFSPPFPFFPSSPTCCRHCHTISHIM